ncbi:carboxymuconolactone decarboxylase family protein [Klebsiella pneumoniae]|uniref:Carboxymuconolactone decarboxylase family protein n=1 Tax=Klebsiella pneumoniae TaxID=573 RepID=A0A927DCF4_KLEPN|nr:carboxymuconolactone decarboxylase family protein [Klebsiella pneumoniae]
MLSPIRWWGRIPWLFYPVSLFVGYIERRRSPLDPVLRSLVSARIAQLCHCEFCIDITSMILAARSGSRGQAAGGRRLAQQYAVQRKERPALAYAEAATQTPPALDDALRSAMAAHFDARALTELTALIGLQNLSARFNAAMAIPAQGLCQIPTSSSQNKE